MLDNIEIVKFLASFSIITIFIYAVYYYVNKNSFRLTSKKEKDIKILDSHFFSKNRALFFIEVKERFFLLSMDEKGFSKLKEWEKGEK